MWVCLFSHGQPPLEGLRSQLILKGEPRADPAALRSMLPRQLTEQEASFKEKPVSSLGYFQGPRVRAAGEGQACEVPGSHAPFFLEAQMGLAHP